MILSPAQLRDLAASVGFPDPALAAAIAMGESYGHSDASNIVTSSQAAAQTAADPNHPVGPERSFGIWQINVLAHPQYDETSLLDPQYNARATYALSSGGANWHQWGAFTNGSYRQYLPPGYAPPAVPPFPQPVVQPTVVPPTRPPAESGALALFGITALAAAAGYAAYQGMRRQPLPAGRF